MSSSTQPFDAVLFAGSSPATVGSALFTRSRRVEPRRARPTSPSVPPVRICRPVDSFWESPDDVGGPTPPEIWDRKD